MQNITLCFHGMTKIYHSGMVEYTKQFVLFVVSHFACGSFVFDLSFAVQHFVSFLVLQEFCQYPGEFALLWVVQLRWKEK